jgi:hypothetical protein
MQSELSFARFASSLASFAVMKLLTFMASDKVQNTAEQRKTGRAI